MHQLIISRKIIVLYTRVCFSYYCNLDALGNLLAIHVSRRKRSNLSVVSNTAPSPARHPIRRAYARAQAGAGRPGILPASVIIITIILPRISPPDPGRGGRNPRAPKHVPSFPN